MATVVHLPLNEIEPKVLDVVSHQLGIARQKLRPTDRLIQDLHCDSLDLVELIMELEESFKLLCLTIHHALSTRRFSRDSRFDSPTWRNWFICSRALELRPEAAG